MMSSMALSSASLCSSIVSQHPKLSFTASPPLFHSQTTKPISVKRNIVTLAAPETLTGETVTGIESSDNTPQPTKKEVKQDEKSRVVLKFVWMEKNIGLGLDQHVPGHGTIPLSPYFFWPRKDAWEELKSTLEAKPWISQKKMIILLNQATDIINLWQQSGGNLTSQ
ncbi:PREDICTED: 30S ribosomal protein 3-1, chloroplastic-like [Camelina sativa]|uniref:30S ribosomal protein 3-1, chloroplastic-like n=1 Tax=Camelina sativa TaxID=90675 RepID=A0ABM0WGL4_CAMSA|nr:PREDICTED: 30S ribosomal protein 3-1, chloroplastic-like [Camelina sativa]